jgi:thioredoxin reductase
MLRQKTRKTSVVILGGSAAGLTAAITAIDACVQRRMTADEMATFQMGTHPALTASPIAYPLVNAAEEAVVGLRRKSSG